MIETNHHIWKTFDEWSKEGYWIRKGSKATWFGNIAHFSDDQVVKKQNRRGSIFDPDRPDWDEFDDDDSWFDPMTMD